MGSGFALCVSFLALGSVALTASAAPIGPLLLVNAALQAILFTVVACVPFLRTGRVSYVDIAWPFGVAVVGGVILTMGTGHPVRMTVVGAVYLLIGLRMGIAALVMAKTVGVIVQTEFPRYVYRRMRLEQAGGGRVRLHLLSDIVAQGLANASVLALPGLLLATNPSERVSGLELAGLALWAGGYLFESIADAQKMRFISKNEGGVCTVGLWRYSRHPNYFGEWLVWTGLVVAAIPSWLALQGREAPLTWVGLGVGLVGASVTMYLSLVHLTGAVPAEHYSALKRPGYRRYQQRTSRFFPWSPRPAPADEGA